MSTIKVFCVLFACVFLAACSPRLDVNELFFTYGSRVRYDERNTEDASDAGNDGGAGHDETAVDAGAPVDAGDTEDAGVDAVPSKCSGACLPALAGWSAPLLVAIAAEPWALPSCPKGYESSDLGSLDVLASPAACSPCACDAPQGGSCAPSPNAAPIVVSDNTCTAVLGGSLGGSWGVTSQGGFKDGACAAVTMIGNPYAMRALYSNAVVGAWQSSPGTCAASGGDATIEPYTWGNYARACSPLVATSEACAAGETCGSVESSFLSCIVRDGSHDCPDGMDRREVYRAAHDFRACSSCGCAAPVDETCTWAFDAFEQANCEGSPVASLDASPGSSGSVTAGSCAPIDPASVVRSIQAHEKPSKGGTCAPVGGTPIGSVAPLDAVTICCAP